MELWTALTGARTACAWRVHGVCTACAWHVHGMRMAWGRGALRALRLSGSSLSASLAALIALTHCDDLTWQAAMLPWSEARSGEAVSGESGLAL